MGSAPEELEGEGLRWSRCGLGCCVAGLRRLNTKLLSLLHFAFCEVEERIHFKDDNRRHMRLRLIGDFKAISLYSYTT